MKKIVLILAVLFALLSCSITSNANSLTNFTSSTTSYTDVIKIEYVIIGDQWYKITYYSDGSWEAQAVASSED